MHPPLHFLLLPLMNPRPLHPCTSTTPLIPGCPQTCLSLSLANWNCAAVVQPRKGLEPRVHHLWEALARSRVRLKALALEPWALHKQ